MPTANIFDRLQRHPLRITEEGSKKPAAFVHGWNDALYISLSIEGPPAAPGSWYPQGYRAGWENCRALLEALQPKVDNAALADRVVEATTELRHTAG